MRDAESILGYYRCTRSALVDPVFTYLTCLLTVLTSERRHRLGQLNDVAVRLAEDERAFHVRIRALNPGGTVHSPYSRVRPSEPHAPYRELGKTD